MRLQKLLAEAGLGSRRASEDIIREGRVMVNGTVVSTLGTKVDPAQDRVSVDGQIVRARRKLYIALNKPRGYLCSRGDPLDRWCVGALLPPEWSNLYPVGRLDRDTEGLLFLTNDGDFCLRLTHPRYEIVKKYRATIDGRIEPEVVARLNQGVRDQGEILKAKSTRILLQNNTQSVVELELTEGRNHEVKRLFQSQGLTVSRLQRLQIGPIKLRELPVGKWRTLTETEIKSLLPEV